MYLIKSFTIGPINTCLKIIIIFLKFEAGRLTVRLRPDLVSIRVQTMEPSGLPQRLPFQLVPRVEPLTVSYVRVHSNFGRGDRIRFSLP